MVGFFRFSEWSLSKGIFRAVKAEDKGKTMNFLQPGTIRCQLNAEAAVQLGWIELCDGNSYKSKAPEFNLERHCSGAVYMWVTTHFLKEYDLRKANSIRISPWRYAFTIVGTAVKCGVYYLDGEKAVAIIDRARDGSRSGQVDTTVEIVSDDLGLVDEFCKIIRHGDLEADGQAGGRIRTISWEASSAN